MFSIKQEPIEYRDPVPEEACQEGSYSDERRTRDRWGTNKPKITKTVRDQRNKQRKAAQRRNRK